jgi:hypothetical protein
MMLLPGSDLQKNIYHSEVYLPNYLQTESLNRIDQKNQKNIETKKTLLTRIVNEHASLPGLENARRKKNDFVKISAKKFFFRFRNVSAAPNRKRPADFRETTLGRYSPMLKTGSAVCCSQPNGNVRNILESL